jgi:hypothetical protein
MSDGVAANATGQWSDAVALWRVGAAPASDVIDAAVECLVADVDSPALRELAGESPRESRFILDPLIDQALDELGVDRLVVANPQQAALTAVLKRFKRGQLTAAAAAQWAHRYIGHLGDARCQVFVDFDDMYDTVNYQASYTAADLDEWMAEESDAFLAGRASAQRRTRSHHDPCPVWSLGPGSRPA